MTVKANSYYKENLIALIRAIAGDVVYINTPRIFFDLTHDIAVAAMISQLIYWSDKAGRADGFIYKSYRNWYDEVGASRYAVQKFKKLPFVISKLIRANGAPTTHYRIDMDKLLDALRTLVPDAQPFSPDPRPENERSIDPFQTIGEPFSNNPLPEIEQSIDPFQTIDMPISNNPLSENEQSLTDTTTDTTTDITTLKEGPPFFFNDPDFSEVDHEKETPKIAGSDKSVMQAGRTIDHEHFKQFLAALAEITGYDLAIKKSAARLMVAARQLVGAGYTMADLYHFLSYWKDTDWRWKKDNQLPTPEDVLLNISRSKYYRKKSLRRWLGQD